MGQNNSKPKAVVAIDFGTTKSGYAFSFNDPNNIHVNEFAYRGITEKIPTTLLVQGLPEKPVFFAFGKEAVDKFNHPEIFNNTEIHGFKNYKMCLFQQAYTMESITPSKALVPITAIVEHTIAFLYSCVMEQFGKMPNVNSKTITLPDEIQWVITVPAIWNNAAKQIVRNAAEKIGIPKSLILALEPEAAALCCRFNRDLTFIPGTKYMIVDCGGGTVDIVFHEIDAKGNTLELRAPVGGPWGSTLVDNNFHQLMLIIFGQEELEKDKLSYADVLSDFEDKKEEYKPSNQHKVRIDIKGLRARFLEEYNDRNSPTRRITIENNRIEIPKEVMESLFEGPITSIVNCIEGLLASLQTPLNYIILVGGFSRNVMLQDRVRNIQLVQQSQIVIPERSHMVVMEGAVHFGLNPNIILSRFSAYSYGIKAVRIFKDGDPEEHKVWLQDIPFCDNVFDAFVKINERIHVDHEVVRLYGWSWGEQTVAVEVYATKDPNLKYITNNMQRVGCLNVRVPPNEPHTEKNIEVIMLFGGTEIKVKARHLITKETLDCTIDFFFASGLAQ